MWWVNLIGVVVGYGGCKELVSSSSDGVWKVIDFCCNVDSVGVDGFYFWYYCGE